MTHVLSYMPIRFVAVVICCVASFAPLLAHAAIFETIVYTPERMVVGVAGEHTLAITTADPFISGDQIEITFESGFGVPSFESGDVSVQVNGTPKTAGVEYALTQVGVRVYFTFLEGYPIGSIFDITLGVSGGMQITNPVVTGRHAITFTHLTETRVLQIPIVSGDQIVVSAYVPSKVTGGGGSGGGVRTSARPYVTQMLASAIAKGNILVAQLPVMLDGGEGLQGFSVMEGDEEIGIIDTFVFGNNVFIVTEETVSDDINTLSYNPEGASLSVEGTDLGIGPFTLDLIDPLKPICDPYFTQVYIRGDQSQGVARMQEFLLGVGDDSVSVDGVFGHRTLGAVRRFQDLFMIDEGVSSASFTTNVWDIPTFTRANRILCGDEQLLSPSTQLYCPVPFPQDLQGGSRGEEVLHLQIFLVQQGIDPGPLDGFFGRETRRAVRKFQRIIDVPAKRGVFDGPTRSYSTNRICPS